MYVIDEIDYRPEKAPVGTVWVATIPNDKMVLWIRVEPDLMVSIDAAGFIDVAPANLFDLTESDIKRYDVEEP